MRATMSHLKTLPAVAILALAASAVQAQPEIDTFDTDQALITAPPSAFSAATTLGFDIVEGEREIALESLSGPGNITAEVAGGALTVSADAGTRGEARVQWDCQHDGADPSIDTIGLGWLDFTFGGADALRVTVSSATAGTQLVFEVFTDSDLSSTRVLVLPVVSTSTTFDLSYSGFLPRLGAGADFTAVGAVTMAVRATSGSVVIDSLEIAQAAATATATKADQIAVDNPPGGSANPGDTLEYTVTVQSAGGDAGSVVFSDNVGAHTTAAGALEVSPLARDDAYSFPEAGPFTVATPGVLTNDLDADGDPMTVTGFTATTTRGGTVNVASNGGFTYTPPAGLSGADTFTYTIDDGNGITDSAVVSVSVVDEAPSIVQTTPADLAVNVPTNQTITIEFSEPVSYDPALSFLVFCNTVGPISFTLGTTSPSQTVTIIPDLLLPENDDCQVITLADEISDVDTNDPPDTFAGFFHAFIFTTEGSPFVQATTPADTATEIASNTDVVIDFSEPVDVTGSWFTISCATSGAHTAVATGGPTSFTLNPDTDFAPGELCTVTILAAQVNDQDLGDPPDNMTADYVFSFTIDEQPAVFSTTPADNDTAVARNADISVTFTEPVDVAGSWFGISCANSGAHTAVVGGGPTTYTLNPDADFAFGELCTVTIVAAQVSDQDLGDPPNNLAADYVFDFTVIAPPVLTAGGTLAYTENDAATAIDTTITVADADDANLQSAAAQITGNYVNGQDVLSFTNTANITAVFTPATGTLDLTGSDTLANWQTALRSVRYHNTSENPSTLARTVTWTASDGTNTSSPVTSTITVAAANDVPVLTAGGTLNYTENDAATAIDTTITVNDLDSPNLQSATAQVTANYANGEDVLSFVNTANITAVFDAPSGTLTLTGSDTLANWQTALRAVRYHNTSDTPSTLARTVTWIATDGADPSAPVTSTVNVTALADPPVLTAGGTLGFTEGDPATAIDTTITVADNDSTDLASATVQITGNYQNGADVLAFTDTATITGVFTAGTGTLTLTGTDTLANWETALRSVTYRNTSDAPTTTVRTVTWIASDGGVSSSPVTSTINITAVNDAPVNTVPGGQTFDEDTPRTFSAANSNLISVADVDAGTSPVQITLSSTQGTMTLNGVAGLSFTTGDGTADATMTFTGTLTNVNARLNGLVYTPTLNYFGPAAITITTNDQGATGTGGAQSDGPDTIALTINPVNDAPTATAKTHATHSAIGLSINAATHTGELKEGAADVDDAFGELTVELVGAPTPSTATVTQLSATDGSFYFEPPGGFTGAASFQFRICDDNVGDPNQCSTATTATVNVGGAELWFIDDTDASGCGVNCNGSRNKPLVGLNNANAGYVGRGTGDRIFVFSGAYGSGHTFAASERLVGQGASDIVGGLGLTFAPYTNGTLDSMPSPSTAPGIGGTVTAATGSLLRGVAVAVTGATGYSATSVTNLTVSETSVSSNQIAVSASGSSTSGSGIVFMSTTSSGGANGINLANLTGAWSFGGGSLVGNTGAAFNVSGGTAAISYAGTISVTAAGSRPVNIVNMTAAGGPVDFTGGITAGTSASGINLDNNDGVTITFRGGLSLATTTNAAFNAVNGGVVAVCDENPCNPAGTGGLVNTLTTTTGTALNVANTTIGTNRLEFRSISANGAVNGIVLNNTGTSGGLSVKGNSAGNCGGSITVQPLGTPSTANAPVTADCTGGTIQATTGAGILLTSTDNVSLARVYVLNSGTDGIKALDVNGFMLTRSFITDDSGAAGDRGIEIGDFSTGTPVSGTITISDSTIGPTPHDNFGVGIASGTSSWSIINTVFTGSQLNSGFNFEMRNATVSSFMIDGCVLQNQFADGMQMQPASGVAATLTSATIQNSTFVGSNIHMDLNHDGTSSVTYKVLNNTFRNSTGQAVNFFSSASAGTSGAMNGRFEGNRIGNAATPFSGGGSGIRVNINGGAVAKVLLNGNVVRQCPNGRGIEIISRNGTGGTDATLTFNQVDTDFVTTPQNGGFSLANIFMQSNCLSTCNTLRSDVRSNTVPSTPPNGELVAGQLALIRSGASTNQLVDNAPASPDAASELASHNTGNVAVSGTVSLIPGPITTPP
jgi:large repetitive protein